MAVQVKCLSDYLRLLNEYRDQFAQTVRSSGFVFRGMSNSAWKLLPGVFREYPEEMKSSTVVGGGYSGRIYSDAELEILTHFKKEACGLLPHISQKDDFTWLQYAQHYGVPTRLLDFSDNPLVAMYFCCQSESETDGIVWIINHLTFNNWTQNEFFCHLMEPGFTREDLIESILRDLRGDTFEPDDRPKKQRPVIFIPAYIDQRMSAQSSRFMLWGEKQVPLEEMCTSDNEMVLTDGLRIDSFNDQRFWAKLIVPSDCKHRIMKELDLLNINEKSIFPGLDGIGKYINNYYTNNVDDICEFL